MTKRVPANQTATLLTRTSPSAAVGLFIAAGLEMTWALSYCRAFAEVSWQSVTVDVGENRERGAQRCNALEKNQFCVTVTESESSLELPAPATSSLRPSHRRPDPPPALHLMLAAVSSPPRQI